MTILEYKAKLDQELVMAEARVKVVDELIALGIDFRRNEEVDEQSEGENTVVSVEGADPAVIVTDESY